MRVPQLLLAVLLLPGAILLPSGSGAVAAASYLRDPSSSSSSSASWSSEDAIPSSDSIDVRTGRVRSRRAETRSQRRRRLQKYPPYEVWASDHSNSVPNATGLGLRGSYLWIYPNWVIRTQLRSKSGATAVPIPCTPGATQGPCNALDLFPQTLTQVGRDGLTGATLGDLPHFARLHDVRVDPQKKYVNANFFAPGGGYVGILDVVRKEAVALFRLTKFAATDEGRSVHMSFWVDDGTAIVCTNLHGKAIERLNVVRDENGTITDVTFDRGATIGLGTNNTVLEEATYFNGTNAWGNDLVGSLTGEYSPAGLGDLTPDGYCKEDGCPGSAKPPTGRVSNLAICPIPSANDNLYVNFGGGGLVVLDPLSSPISIKGEYDSATFNGAGSGCGGIQVDDQMFMTAGVSVQDEGSEQSTFGIWSFNDTGYDDGPNAMNVPLPTVVFKDPNNTNTIGNIDGVDEPNLTGQIPGNTTRRDAQGLVDTSKGHIHQFDRIQNTASTFSVDTYHMRTYDLTSRNGRLGRPTIFDDCGPCHHKSVADDDALVPNNPSPDLACKAPNGRYIFVGLRGPAPVTAPHSSQGSCPGIGIVQVRWSGKRGRLKDVIRTTNTVDNAPLPVIEGGTQYQGVERSDVHSVVVVEREDLRRVRPVDDEEDDEEEEDEEEEGDPMVE